MEYNEIDTRVAILETKLESMESSLQEIKSDMEEHYKEDTDRMFEIKSGLDKLGNQINISKSFVGGIVFILSCIWAIFLVFKETIFHNVVSK